MKPIVRNTIAVVVGLVVGNIVNLSLIQAGYSVFPTGIDVNDMEALAKFLEDADSKFFIFPFIAHAAGTLFGAIVAAIISKNRKVTVALIIGAFFLLGGIAMSFLLPAPSWFIAMDLIAAYFPMALIGAMIAKGLRRKR
jgi:hypothetical protein